MSAFLLVAGGLALGGLIAWVFLGMRLSAGKALNEELQRQLALKSAECETLGGRVLSEATQKAEALARLEESRKGLEEEKASREAMKQAFEALSSAALKSNSEDFLRLANENLGKVMEDAKGRMREHQSAMNGLLPPLVESLKKYEEEFRRMEIARKEDYTGLGSQIKMLQGVSQELSTALRRPHVRGRWTEIQLRRVVEMAGMAPHCDFVEQVSVSTEEGRLRPDMVIRLPGKRSIVVDAKCSTETLMDAISAKTEEEKRQALERHARNVKNHVDGLASKKYWEQFDKTPDMVVLFMGESALVAAFETGGTLLEDSLSKRVLLATPTTLFALLIAVAHGWRQEGLAENAEKIALLGKELYERIAVWCRGLSDVGVHLDKAVRAWDQSVGSLQARVLPSFRRFRELGINGPDLPEPRLVEKLPRKLEPPDAPPAASPDSTKDAPSDAPPE